MLRPVCASATNVASNLQFVRNYAFKSDLKIKWVRPEKLPSYNPQKSGDLEPLNQIDKTLYPPEFQSSRELATADETVKKLFALQFAPRKKTIQLYYENMMSRVKRHPLDDVSEEVKIARWTGRIRAWQELMERFPRDKRLKVCVNEVIDRRKKHLKELRKIDYKKFEWLIEQLNIVYKPTPIDLHKVTRKDSLRKLTQKYCDNIRDERLNEYKLKLQAEQPAFLEEKIQTLEYIREEQRKLNAEVTVTQEEINSAKKQLEEVLKRNKEEENDADKDNQ